MNRLIIAVCAVVREAQPLLDRLGGVREQAGLRVPAWQAHQDDARILCIAGGMGKANAAHAVTAALCREPTAFVVGFGVAGAFPSSGLAAGDVAIAREEVYADEGAETPSGWIGCEAMGIPLLESGPERYFNHFPTDHELSDALSAAAAEGGTRPKEGRFVTVSTCSGTQARAAVLSERFDPICESMEGAAWAHIARMYDAPFAEIRGISNIVEDRDPGRWRIDDAAEGAASVLARFFTAWSSEPNE